MYREVDVFLLSRKLPVCCSLVSTQREPLEVSLRTPRRAHDDRRIHPMGGFTSCIHTQLARCAGSFFRRRWLSRCYVPTSAIDIKYQHAWTTFHKTVVQRRYSPAMVDQNRGSPRLAHLHLPNPSTFEQAAQSLWVWNPPFSYNCSVV